MLDRFIRDDGCYVISAGMVAGSIGLFREVLSLLDRGYVMGLSGDCYVLMPVSADMGVVSSFSGELVNCSDEVSRLFMEGYSRAMFFRFPSYMYWGMAEVRRSVDYVLSRSEGIYYKCRGYIPVLSYKGGIFSISEVRLVKDSVFLCS